MRNYWWWLLYSPLPGHWAPSRTWSHKHPFELVLSLIVHILCSSLTACFHYQILLAATYCLLTSQLYPPIFNYLSWWNVCPCFFLIIQCLYCSSLQTLLTLGFEVACKGKFDKIRSSTREAWHSLSRVTWPIIKTIFSLKLDCENKAFFPNNMLPVYRFLSVDAFEKWCFFLCCWMAWVSCLIFLGEANWLILLSAQKIDPEV